MKTLDEQTAYNIDKIVLKHHPYAMVRSQLHEEKGYKILYVLTKEISPEFLDEVLDLVRSIQISRDEIYFKVDFIPDQTT